MVQLLGDTFTGANGAAWSSTWTNGLSPGAGGSRTIQSDTGQLVTGSNATPYSGANRISMRNTGAAPADAVVAFRFRWPAGDECYPRFYLRSANTSLDGQGGYWVELNKGGNYAIMGRGVSFTNVSLPANTSADRLNKTWATNTWYWVRFGIVGTTIQFRVWNDVAVEPATWDKTATDATIAGAASGTGVTVGPGATPSSTWQMDDFWMDSSFTVPLAGGPGVSGMVTSGPAGGIIAGGGGPR